MAVSPANVLPAPANCIVPAVPKLLVFNAGLPAVVCTVPSENTMPLLVAVFAILTLPHTYASLLTPAAAIIPAAVLVPIPIAPVNKLLLPPAFTLPTIPAPPATWNAPVVVLILALVLSISTFCPNLANTLPINAFTVAVPATFNVVAVYICPPACIAPPTPTPPEVTINAPVPVLVLAFAELTVTFCPNEP